MDLPHITQVVVDPHYSTVLVSPAEADMGIPDMPLIFLLVDT